MFILSDYKKNTSSSRHCLIRLNTPRGTYSRMIINYSLDSSFLTNISSPTYRNYLRHENQSFPSISARSFYKREFFKLWLTCLITGHLSLQSSLIDAAALAKSVSPFTSKSVDPYTLEDVVSKN